jgi:hypothetical protein
MANITPKTNKLVFNDEILNVLPTNKELKHGVAMVKRNEDPSYQEKRLESLRRVMETDEWKLKNNLAKEIWSNDPVWQQEQQQRLQKRSENIDWKNNVARAAKEKSRCCITPLGIFQSVHQAGDYYDTQRGTKCGRTVVCRNLKKGTTGYKYIDIEEYIMLTGKGT